MIIDSIGRYSLYQEQFEDSEGFDKNWFQINLDDQCVHLINGFSYDTDGIFEYFRKWVEDHDR